MDFDALMQAANAQVNQHLGSAATLNGVALRGVLSLPYADSRLSGVDMREAGPRFFCGETIAATRGQLLVCNGASYVVLHAEPDAVGGTVLHLEAQ